MTCKCTHPPSSHQNGGGPCSECKCSEYMAVSDDWLEVKDSGERHEFSTGSVRDTRQGKGRFDLIPYEGLRRLAIHFENGAKKYGDHNWRKGQPMHVYMSSGISHAFRYLVGMRDEDHLAAATWNLLCALATEEMIANGDLPPELMDV